MMMLIKPEQSAADTAARLLLAEVADAFGGELRVPVITSMLLSTRTGQRLYFGDQLTISFIGGRLDESSIPTFPNRDRRQLAEAMSNASDPPGLRPYNRGREMQVPLPKLLRHLAKHAVIRERCPWLPERLQVIETLEELV
jgi:hypothetical protein